MSLNPFNKPIIPRGTGKEATLSKAIFGTTIAAIVLVIALIMTLALTLSVGDAAPRAAPTLLAPMVGGAPSAPAQVVGSEFPPPLPIPPRLDPEPLDPIPPGTPQSNLQSTSTGQLRFAVDGVRSNGAPRVVARSYDNLPWEALRDEDNASMEVRCTTADSSSCVIYGTASPTYVDAPVPAEALNVDNTGKAARLLSQFTFGATMAEITAAAAQTPEVWMQSQFNVTPSLLRGYIRKRQNPLPDQLTDLGNLQSICAVGARFVNVTGGGSSANTQSFADGDLLLNVIREEGKYALVSATGCDPYKFTGGLDAYFVHRGVTYKYEPRLLWLKNSFGLPAGGVPGQMCPAVPKTFVNAWSCVRRPSCGLPAVTSVEMQLNTAALRRWYTGSTRYVYVVKNLRLESSFDVSPCQGRSRWQRSAGACASPSSLDGTTTTILTNALTSSGDNKNPYVRDIELPGGGGCTAGSGVSLTVSGECFTHVHPDLFQVRDFTNWGTGTLHPGNEVTPGVPRSPNPIFQWAINGGVDLLFPASHPMSRWDETNLRHIPVVGRFGDSVDFLALAGELKTSDMAVYAGAAEVSLSGSFESCGSPGEEANDGRLGHRYIIPREDVSTNDQRAMLDWPYDWNMGKSMAWMNNVVKAPDQLRQRVAWALQQIFTIGDNSAIQRTLTDTWASYYDIFVRHAFGNYRDIMKEVSFHPLMSDYLTYRDSESFEVSGSFPDENYAREIMQLFTIGLYKLKRDGTRLLDALSRLIDSYTDTDIVDFARIWTGFTLQPKRSNIEQLSGRDGNGIDPMRINPAWRDKLPKAKLDSGFIGDQYPLCTEFPSRPWFRIGAKYVYTGGSSDEGDLVDSEDPQTFRNRPRFAPAADSPLFNLLCGPLVNGECTFPDEVVLKSNLPCGVDCGAEDVVSVKIKKGSLVGYYTYVPAPCVRLTFFNSGKVLSYRDAHQCGNPVEAFGNPLCCQADDEDSFGSNENTTGLCHHVNERAPFDVVKARCEAAGLVVCKGIRRRWPNWRNSCAESMPIWIDEPCRVSLQILPTGRVMLNTNTSGIAFFRESNGNQFRVRWVNNSYPTTVAPGCGAGCVQVNTAADPTCVCNVTASESVLWTSMPTAKEVARGALIGSLPVAAYDNGTFVQCMTTECTADPKMKVWLRDGATDWRNITTVFEIQPVLHPEDPVKYLLNRKSTVSLTDQPSRSFQNPPHFMPLLGDFQPVVAPHRSSALWLPRAEQEVDALLDHLFYHENTAPFVAYRMIQRLVTSNPSLRYVRSVANAFREGWYNNKVYSGRYGDMGATVAAVLLDQEARSTVVEADPRHGSFYEPIMKVSRFLRSLNFQTKDGREIDTSTTGVRIDQAAFRQPSVFGFYLPEFRPDGPVEDQGLVGPEAQILTTPSIVHYFNGMSSLINNGLTSCNGGFGYNSGRSCSNQANRNRTSDGFLMYRPTATAAADVVNEMDLLLTSKRLSGPTRSFLTTEYTKDLTDSDAETAYKRLLKRFMATIEFQVNNLNVLSSANRPPLNLAGGGQGRPYKAIVVVFMGGGADSFNMIVPHSGCGKDYYSEYAAVRRQATVPGNLLLPIDVTGQPCTRFGVHWELAGIKQLYDDGDAAFIANIGGLVEPLNKTEWRDRRSSKLKPPSPSAHNIAQRSLQNVHAQESNAKGILGRAVDSLKSIPNPYATEMYSLAGNQKMLQAVLSKPDLIDSRRGVVALEDKTFVTDVVNNVTRFVTNTSFGETYATLVSESLQKNERIGQLLDSANVSDFGRGYSDQLEQVARLIKIRQELGTERAVFFTSRGGWDTHRSLTPPWADVNDSLMGFVSELKSQGVWNDVVIVSVSDFGRTLTSNGAGTDHAWGGHVFMLGGGIKGGKFHGKYPDTLLPDGDLNTGGRGRIIPTLGWESMWEGILDWFGVPASERDKVMPNRFRFPSDKLLHRTDMFN